MSGEIVVIYRQNIRSRHRYERHRESIERPKAMSQDLVSEGALMPSEGGYEGQGGSYCRTGESGSREAQTLIEVSNSSQQQENPSRRTHDRSSSTCNHLISNRNGELANSNHGNQFIGLAYSSLRTGRVRGPGGHGLGSVKLESGANSGGDSKLKVGPMKGVKSSTGAYGRVSKLTPAFGCWMDWVE